MEDSAVMLSGHKWPLRSSLTLCSLPYRVSAPNDHACTRTNDTSCIPSSSVTILRNMFESCAKRAWFSRIRFALIALPSSPGHPQDLTCRSRPSHGLPACPRNALGCRSGAWPAEQRFSTAKTSPTTARRFEHRCAALRRMPSRIVIEPLLPWHRLPFTYGPLGRHPSALGFRRRSTAGGCGCRYRVRRRTAGQRVRRRVPLLG